MAGNPRVFGLLEEMLNSGATPEEACHDCPELLSEVRRRWHEFCAIDEQVGALLPGFRTTADAATISRSAVAGLPHIPGYEVEAVLGQGGMGVVYRVRHLKLNRVVALKTLLAGACAGPVERARFQREAEAVAGLCHANIVQVYEVGEHDGRPYFTMELIDGGSLAQKLAAVPTTVRRAAELVASLAEAVSVAHSAGIVHRDLKPANILLTADGKPKISDFGVARRLAGNANLTATGTAIGTPSYMAPEQASGAAVPIGPATDVYGLGAILYELLTGRPPFRGETAVSILYQVTTRDPVSPSRLNPKVPCDLETVCLKCLHKEPQRRYASARTLAEDLRRYLLGQVVAARPVGRLERTAKWVRRNPTVAGLSAVAALALVAGTVVSVLFGVDAGRKADALEQQTIQLQAQTVAAQENARRAEENEKEAGRVLVSGLLSPIGRNPHQLTFPLDAAETEAVRQLRAAPVPLRLQFLKTALRDPEAARRIGRRSDWVVQAIVGCDRDLRAEVARLVVRSIQEPGSPHEVKLACARLGLALNLAERAWAEHSADALLVELRNPSIERDDYPPLAEAFAVVSERLPPARAADCAAQALDFFFALLAQPEGQGLTHNHIGLALAALGPALDAATAARAAETLAALIRRSNRYQYLWLPLSKALAAVCRRLPAPEAAVHIDGTVDFFVLEMRATTKESDKSRYLWQVEAVGALCGRLDADRASRVASAFIAVLGDHQTFGEHKHQFISHPNYVRLLTGVAGRLDTRGSLRAAEELVLVLRTAENSAISLEELRTVLAALCRGLDAAGAARMAAALVEADRDPKTAVMAHVVFANAFAALADRLTPDQAVALESALVDPLLADLADVKLPAFTGFVGHALATVCGRPKATSAARGAEALGAALRDPRVPLQTLKTLAAALATVSGQLPSKEASAHVNRAVEVLDTLWVAKESRPDRAAVAEALAGLWARLDRAAAIGRARRAAAGLEDALRDPNAQSTDLADLASALSAVYNHLDPPERSGHANAVADNLIAALHKPRSHVVRASLLSRALAALCAHQDRLGADRTADALLALLEDPNLQPVSTGPIPATHLDVFVLYEALFNTVASRLDEHALQRFLNQPLAVGRYQRAVLDVLARSKTRSFRNTWDYLDGHASN